MFTAQRSLTESSHGFSRSVRRRSSRFLKFRIPQCVLLLLRSRSVFRSQCYSPWFTNSLPKGSFGQKISIPHRRDQLSASRGASSTSSSSGLCCSLLQCLSSGDFHFTGRLASRSLKKASQFCRL